MISVNSCADYPVVQSSVWSTQSATFESPNLGFLFTNPGSASNQITASIDLSLYNVSPNNHYVITRKFLNGTDTTIASFSYPSYQLQFELFPLDTAVFSLEKGLLSKE